MLSKFAQNILGQLKKDTVSRNSRRSANWLLNKIRKQANSKQVSKPKIGRMYLYVYDAKFKDTLPYWDTNPLIIMIGPAKDGFYGINFHYLPLRERIELLEMIVPFQKLISARTQKEVSINYQKLLKLSKTYWKHCFKHYLFSQLNTRLIEVPMEEWINTVSLPLAHFKGATASQVWKDRF